MPDFNKGDFTQQGINGHVNAIVRLNEKRLINIDLTSNEEAEGCTISGQVTDLLNNMTYSLAAGPSGPVFVVPEQTITSAADAWVPIADFDLGDLDTGDYIIMKAVGEAYGNEIFGYQWSEIYQDTPDGPRYVAFTFTINIGGTPVTVQTDMIEGAADGQWGVRVLVNNVQTVFSNITISAIPGF